MPMRDADSLPFAHGGPPLAGRLRAAPEDFRVDEVLGYAADGEGEHVLLEVEKREVNTAWLARELARFVGVAPRAVGYAGLKDRHAVTRQAFSVQLAGRPEPDWSAFGRAGVRILAATRHRRKIKRGALAGNRFRLIVREVCGARPAAAAVLEAVAGQGVPNYFGEQRFGHGGHNLERARAMFDGRRVDRDTRSILLSAVRSHLFNQVLAERVRVGSWNGAMPGEVWCLDGSRAHFGPEPFDAALRERLQRGDIHPSGPLWGRGDPPSADACRELELMVATRDPGLIEGLHAYGLEQARRPLRLVPADMSWDWPDTETLTLAFTLPAGSYATVVMRELLGAPKGPAIG